MKAKKEHRVPLTPRCIEIFEAAKELSDGSSDFIFPGDKPGRPLSNMLFHALLRRMEKTGMTPHGFRSSFRDWAEEKTNHSQRTIETALAHVVKDKTEAAYLRTQLFEKRKELMAQWARFATAAPAKKVVPIRPVDLPKRASRWTPGDDSNKGASAEGRKIHCGCDWPAVNQQRGFWPPVMLYKDRDTL